MAPDTDQRETIIAALKQFGTHPLGEAARGLFAALGYRSDRTLPITTTEEFCEKLDPHGRLTDRERENLGKLQTLQLLDRKSVV